MRGDTLKVEKKSKVSNRDGKHDLTLLNANQDAEESLEDIKVDETNLEKEIDNDNKSIETLKERLQNEQKLLKDHKVLLSKKKVLAQKREQIEKVLQANEEEDIDSQTSDVRVLSQAAMPKAAV